jgi:hypothetical protein
MSALFGLAEGEVPVCFVNIGTVDKRKAQRQRPPPAEFFSDL